MVILPEHKILPPRLGRDSMGLTEIFGWNYRRLHEWYLTVTPR